MPSEIHDAEKFVEISGRAEYCAVKRLKDVVKLKIRTAKQLYTLKVGAMGLVDYVVDLANKNIARVSFKLVF